MDLQKDFNNYVSEFCRLDLSEKRSIIVTDLKETLGVMQKVSNDIGNNDLLLLSKELLDIKDLNSCSEEDFDEAVFVYIHAIQESFGTILERISKDYYE